MTTGGKEGVDEMVYDFVVLCVLACIWGGGGGGGGGDLQASIPILL